MKKTTRLFLKLWGRIKKVRIKYLFLSSAVFFVLLIFFILSFSAYSTLKDARNLFFSIVNNKTENFNNDYQKFEADTHKWSRLIKLADYLSFGLLDKKYDLVKQIDLFQSFVDQLPEILGQNSLKIYFVLLQNDKELRPTGGFLGSYAKIKFYKGGLNEVTIRDVYIPDGQLPGHVEPPAPIQEAFKQGWWKLRDSNWDPNFPASAKVINWFFQKGNEEKSDGIVAVNFSFFQELLRELGTIYLPTHKTVVNADNFYQIAQAYSETNFFPGSTQKTDILSDLGWAFFEKVKGIKKNVLLGLFQLTFLNLKEKHIFAYFFNVPKMNNFLAQLGWDGSIRKNLLISGKKVNDYLFVVESNLGANKANCCVTRKMEHFIDFRQDDKIKENIKISYENNSEVNTPVPPIFWGGNYLNYLRVYLPVEAQLGEVYFNDKQVQKNEITTEIDKQLNLISYGFFVKIFAKSKSNVSINYFFNKPKEIENYSLYVQKQSGIKQVPYTIHLSVLDNHILTSFSKRFSKRNFSLSGKIRKDEEIFTLSW